MFRFGCVSFAVFEPSCSTRCSSYVLRCIRSRFHLPYIQAFSKLTFLLSCGASRGKVESLPRTRRGILVSHRHHSSFSKFPTWHRYRFRPQEVLIQFTMHRLRSFFTFPHVTSKCFECCCCQLRWVSLSLLAWLCPPAQVADSVSAGSGMLVSHPVRRWLGRFSHLFPTRCHVPSPNMHMSHRVTVRSAQEHNAFIGVLDHDETCRGSPPLRPSHPSRPPPIAPPPFCLKPLLDVPLSQWRPDKLSPLISIVGMDVSSLLHLPVCRR